MAEPGSDDHTQQQFGAAAPPYGPAAYGGVSPRGPHATGPLGDWLHEAGAAWSGAPPGYAAPGYPAAPPPSPWITPPHLDPEEARGRWSIGTAAPWVIAGLLCAVLLTGRDAPAAGAGDLPAEAASTGPAALAPAPVEALGAAAPGPPSCTAVVP